MVLNTQQLHYLLEIERVRSISQAASNLFMGQPNLSRVLRDVEGTLGFPIFERTRKGVRPTEKGSVFLQHAHNILREADFMEQLGPNGSQANRLRICLPRSYFYFDKVAEFLRTLPSQDGLDVNIRECHPRQALELLDSGSVEIAIIRHATEYQDYFEEQAAQRNFAMIPLSILKYQVVLSATHKLAGNDHVTKEELEAYTEIMHRDTFYTPSKAGKDHSRIYAVDRLSQLQLLHSLPETYLWAEPLPQALLKKEWLVQLPCTNGGTTYKNVLAYKPQCAMSETERSFLSFLESSQP